MRVQRTESDGCQSWRSIPGKRYIQRGEAAVEQRVGADDRHGCGKPAAERSQLNPVLGAHLGVGRERTNTTKVPQRGILEMRGTGRVHWLRVGSRASRLLRARPRAAPASSRDDASTWSSNGPLQHSGSRTTEHHTWPLRSAEQHARGESSDHGVIQRRHLEAVPPAGAELSRRRYTS